MKLKLKNKKESIKNFRELNLQDLINKMTNYFEVINMTDFGVSPILLATGVVNKWINQGLINEFGELKVLLDS